MKVHKPAYEEQKRRFAEARKVEALMKRQKEEEEYNLNPHRCVVCNSIIDFERAIKKHVKCCSPSCVVKWGNLHRPPRSKESKMKTSKGLLRYWDSPEGQEASKKRVKTYICEMCGKEFRREKGKHKSRKYCSNECSFQALSQKRITKIVKDGGSNFSTKWTLNYRDKEYKCDSLLEAAAIIWLFENENATSISRADLILEFVASDNKVHRYNPDFFVAIGEDTFIIEVKQDWERTTKTEDWHRYSLFWEEKKKALAEYASEHGYKWLWLNPNYNKDFKKLYRKIQFNKSLYNLTKKSHFGEMES